MITGDHPTIAVAKGVGLAPTGVLTGAGLDRMPEAELRKVVAQTNVFARNRLRDSPTPLPPAGTPVSARSDVRQARLRVTYTGQPHAGGS